LALEAQKFKIKMKKIYTFRTQLGENNPAELKNEIQVSKSVCSCDKPWYAANINWPNSSSFDKKQNRYQNYGPKNTTRKYCSSVSYCSLFLKFVSNQKWNNLWLLKCKFRLFLFVLEKHIIIIVHFFLNNWCSFFFLF
jgi:hypothetical protein